MMDANPELQELKPWFDGSLLNPTTAAAAKVPNLGSIIAEGIQNKETIILETLKHVSLLPYSNPKSRSKSKSQSQSQSYGGETEDNGTTQPNSSSNFSSKTFCITGSLPSGLKKAFYKDPLQTQGHQLVDDLTKDIDYLVVADPSSQSAKTKKAEKLGIPIITEETLREFAGLRG
jgi:NAD-dependent DNA ligase